MLCVRHALIALISAWLLHGCASTSTSVSDLLQSAATEAFPSAHQIQQVPFFAQSKYQCGPAALATVLKFSEVSISPDELVDDVYVPELKGSLQIEMLTAARRHQRLAYVIEPTMQTLLEEVSAGQPVLVLQNLGLSWLEQWHYAVVTGFDLKQQIITLNSGTNEHYQMSLATFEKTWQRAEQWAMITVTPGKVTPTMREVEYFESAVAFEQSNTPPLANLVYVAGLESWPNSELLNMAYANFLYGQERKEEAVLAYQQVIKLNAQHAAAHNNLAQTLSELGKLSEAQRHAEIAVELGGRHAQHYADTLNNIQKQIQ